MSYEKATILSTISKIQNGELVLPAIQRDFVWEPERMYKLLDSIFRGYPFSTLLFWNTKQRIQYREFTKDWAGDYRFTFQVKPDGKKGTMVLDGQQRLQTLYLALQGTYESKILYFDLLSGKEPDDVSQARYHFQFLPASEVDVLNVEQAGIQHWVPLREMANLTSKQTTTKAIHYLGQLNIAADSESGQRISHNISTVFGALRADEVLNYFTVDKEYGDDGLETDLEEILEIFVRVNSGGQVLSKSDLMFSLMQMLWEGAADSISDLIETLNRKGRYDFDKDFILKCALVCCGKGAKYEVSKLRSEATVKAIEENFEAISQALENCMDFVVSKSRFLDDRVLRSYNTLIPFVYFFYLQPGQQVKSEETLLQMNYALYLSLMNSLFSRFADNYIDQLVNNTFIPYHQSNPSKFPLDQYLEFLRSKQGHNQLDDWLLQNNIHYLMNILEGGTRLPEGRRTRRPEVDHIFPHSKLIDMKITEEHANHYANFRLISRPENNWKRAQDPQPYFKANPSAAARYYIPTKLLSYEQYDQFLEKRRELIWEHLKRFFGQDGQAATGQPGDTGKLTTIQSTPVDIPPTSLRQTIDGMLTEEQKVLPILQDKTPWLDVFWQRPFSPQWCGRYHWALHSVGIQNVSDLAAATMTLNLKLTHYSNGLPFYQLASPLPDGTQVHIPTREFGAYAWQYVLEELMKRGLDWKQHLDDDKV